MKHSRAVNHTVYLVLILSFGTILAVRSARAQLPKQVIRITVDLSEAPRKLYHAEIDLPVTPGKPVTFITPQWIPGDHAPSGKVASIAGLVFTGSTSNGTKQVLEWRRDEVNLYEFHLHVPIGVSTVHAHLDAVVGRSGSHNLACLEWDRLLLYPAHVPVKDIAVESAITVPAGWNVATALTAVTTSSPPPTTGFYEEVHAPPPGAVTYHYAATTIDQLEDSPVFAGKHFNEYALAPEVTPKHYIDVFSELPGDSNLSPEVLSKLSNLIREAGAAYGSHHYDSYRFLLTLSDDSGGEGLEHAQSSNDSLWEKGLIDQAQLLDASDELAHEFTHSWNGKYRRPEHLYQADYATPEQGALLWVYEGLTQYMGNVLTVRSGFRTPAQYRDQLATLAATLDNESGRSWRSAEDTAIAASIDHNPGAWANWVRGWGFYQEGELLWLDIDTFIQQQTNGRKSLTDFLHLFLGRGGDTGPLVVTYDRQEIIGDLNQVLPFDWESFFHAHVDIPTSHPDFAGLERGYKLVYRDKPNPSELTLSRPRGPLPATLDVWYSLGIRVSINGTLSDVQYGGLADKAGLSPAMKILKVDGEPFSAESLLTAIDKSKDNNTALSLLVQDGMEQSSIRVDYHEGQRYPSLERVGGIPDILDKVLEPLTSAPATPSAKTGSTIPR